LLAQARAAVSDLRALVEGTEGDAALDARAQRSLQGWRDAGLELPRSNADTRQHPTADAFRAYVAEEAEGIAALLAQGVASLAAEPMNRDPLKAILHRQRALLGSARLVEVPVVAEILNAVEDLSRVIARLDVGVKREWLDVYRIALDGLRASIEALRRDQDPPPSIALSRLRHIRTELLERYGSAPAANPAGANPDGFAPPRSELAEPPPAVDRAADAQSVGAVAPVSNPEPVPIAELEYRGTAALRRAAELRERLAPVLAREPALAAAIEELVDLVRLARE
jgi:chemotaxis protein histidine kinase CheA